MKVLFVLHKEADSCFGVSFPMYPGCISCGDTEQEAIENAKEALQAHMDQQHLMYKENDDDDALVVYELDV